MKDNKWLENMLDIDESTAREAAKADGKRQETRHKCITLSLVLLIACILIISVSAYIIDSKRNKLTLPVVGEVSEQSEPVKKIIVHSEIFRLDIPPYENINNNFSSEGYHEIEIDEINYRQTYISIDENYITSNPYQTYVRWHYTTYEGNEEILSEVSDKIELYQILNISKDIMFVHKTSGQLAYNIYFNSNIDCYTLKELLDKIDYNKSNNFGLVYKYVKSESGEYNVTEFLDVPSSEFYEYICNIDTDSMGTINEKIFFENNEFFELRLKSTELAKEYIRFFVNNKGYLKFCFFDQEYDFFIGKGFYDNLNKYVESNCDKYRIEYIYK